MNSVIKVVARYMVKPSEVEKVRTYLNEMAIVTRQEKGNLRYDIYQHLTFPDMIILYEEYEDETALKAHRESEHFENIVTNKILPLLRERNVDVIH